MTSSSPMSDLLVELTHTKDLTQTGRLRILKLVNDLQEKEIKFLTSTLTSYTAVMKERDELRKELEQLRKDCDEYFS